MTKKSTVELTREENPLRSILTLQSIHSAVEEHTNVENYSIVSVTPTATTSMN